ncbi:MAG: phosphate acyltransferase [Gemmatimonadota bacterium]
MRLPPMIRSLHELRQHASRLSHKTIAVAAAAADDTLRAVGEARRRGWADAVLVGDEAVIRNRLEFLELEPDGLEFVHRPGEREAAAAAVALVRAGEADILLKGAVSTADLIHAVLDRGTGLRTGRLLSDVFVIDYTGRGPSQLVGITDGGINPTPDVQQKKAILRNAVHVFHALGVEQPRVAVLSGTEKPTPKLQGSMDAARLTELYEAGDIRECVVDGPLAMDLALSAEAAALKGIVSPVAGRADILLFPTLEAANITAKAIQYWTSQDPGHVVVGAAAPVLIPSRAESVRARLNAIALGSLLAERD